jgi:hypothetical protein
MPEDSILKIKGKLNSIKLDLLIIKKRTPNNENLSKREYLWVIFSYNIYLQIKDLILIIEAHKGVQERSKTGIYIIFRSILEDYFYMKLLLSKGVNMDDHFDAFVGSTTSSNKKHLESLKKIYSTGKFIPETDPKLVTSIEGMDKKIEEYIKELDILTQRNQAEFTRLINIFKNVEKVCEEYDRINNIVKVSKGNEYKSLVWQYNYIYRFNSGYVHQKLNMKEEALDLLWYGKAYENSNEIFSSVLHIISDIKTLK